MSQPLSTQIWALLLLLLRRECGNVPGLVPFKLNPPLLDGFPLVLPSHSRRISTARHGFGPARLFGGHPIIPERASERAGEVRRRRRSASGAATASAAAPAGRCPPKATRRKGRGAVAARWLPGAPCHGKTTCFRGKCVVRVPWFFFLVCFDGVKGLWWVFAVAFGWLLVGVRVLLDLWLLVGLWLVISFRSFFFFSG